MHGSLAPLYTFMNIVCCMYLEERPGWAVWCAVASGGEAGVGTAMAHRCIQQAPSGQVLALPVKHSGSSSSNMVRTKKKRT
jgi:hypothetical protein